MYCLDCHAYRLEVVLKHKDFQGCGTYGGYQQHKLTKEKSCEPCLLAMREYKKTNYYKNYDKNIKRLKKYKASDKAKETLCSKKC